MSTTLSSRTGAPRTTLALAIITLLCLAPFINKAVHIDDYLFIRSAQHIVERPGDPFGITVNWYGAAEPLPTITQNPPLACYYLAATGATLGWSEPALHLAFMLPAVLAVIGTYVLAKDRCAHPAAAAIAMLVSPVFWVSATTLMCDVTMLAFWVWAVVLWTRGIGEDDHRKLAAAALLVTLAALTKYFGAALVPLLLAYTLVKKRWRCWPALWLGIPVLALVAYDWATGQRYGIRMITQASDYAKENRHYTLAWDSLVSTFTFAGGCTIALLFFWHKLWHWRWSLVGLACVAALYAWLVRMPFVGTRPWEEVLQMALFGTLGLGIVALVFADWFRCRDAESTLLGLWTLGTLVFTGALNWTVNGRTILPLAPAVAILLFRQLERRQTSFSLRSLWPIIPAAAVGAAVAYADASFAASSKHAATKLLAEYQPAGRNTLWFQGHWGFQYYMEQQGMPALDIARPRTHLGDRVIIPMHNTSVHGLDPTWFGKIGEIREPIFPWLATMHMDFGAGFYCHRYGQLPYKFGPVPPQRFEILELRMMPLFP